MSRKPMRDVPFHWSYKTLDGLVKSINELPRMPTEDDLRRVLDTALQNQGVKEFIDVIDEHLRILEVMNEQKWEILELFMKGDMEGAAREMDKIMSTADDQMLNLINAELKLTKPEYDPKEALEVLNNLKTAASAFARMDDVDAKKGH